MQSQNSSDQTGPERQYSLRGSQEIVLIYAYRYRIWFET